MSVIYALVQASCLPHEFIKEPGHSESAQPCFSRFSQCLLLVQQLKFSCGPKSIYPIDHDYKRDLCKTVDKTFKLQKRSITRAAQLILNNKKLQLWLSAISKQQDTAIIW